MTTWREKLASVLTPAEVMKAKKWGASRTDLQRAKIKRLADQIEAQKTLGTGMMKDFNAVGMPFTMDTFLAWAQLPAGTYQSRLKKLVEYLRQSIQEH